MKSFFCLLILVSIAGCGGEPPLDDGVYRVYREGETREELEPLQEGERLIAYSHRFLEPGAETARFVVVGSEDGVPLTLEQAPDAVDQPDGRKNLMLTLTDDASEAMRAFSERYLNERVSIVIDGEAVTLHAVRAVIDSGLLQVTRCTDNACEHLFTVLQDNVE